MRRRSALWPALIRLSPCGSSSPPRPPIRAKRPASQPQRRRRCRIRLPLWPLRQRRPIRPRQPKSPAGRQLSRLRRARRSAAPSWPHCYRTSVWLWKRKSGRHCTPQPRSRSMIGPRPHRTSAELSSRNLVEEFQPISDTGFGDDIDRPVRMRLDLLAQEADEGAQILDVLGIGGAPDLLQHEAMGQHLAGMGREQPQYVEFLGRQLDRLAGAGDQALHQIDLEIAGDDRGRYSLLLQTVAKGGTDPGGQFLHAEGLGDVVIRTQIERLDLDMF